MKRNSRSTSVNRNSGSNMSIHGMSQWSYPTNKLISDSWELQQMDVFLLSKVCLEWGWSWEVVEGFSLFF